MADLSTRTEFQLRLTKEEMRLVGLGLIRKLDAPEDIAAALALNTRILELRAAEARQALQVAEGAVVRAKGLEAGSDVAGQSRPHL